MNRLTLYEARQLADEVNQYIGIIAQDHTLTYANEPLLKFSGVHLEHINQIPYWDLPWWENGMRHQNKIIFAIERAFFGETVRFDTTFLKYDGTLHEIDFIIKPLYKRNQIVAVIAMGYNITEFVNTQKALTKYQRQLDAFFTSSSEGYFFYLLDFPVYLPEIIDQSYTEKVLSHQSLSFYNKKLETILNRTVVLESSVFDILPSSNTVIYEEWTNMLKHGKTTFDTTLKMGNSSDMSLSPDFFEYTTHENHDTTYFDPTLLHLRITLVAIYDETHAFEGNFAIVRDRTQEVRNMKRLEFLANKDPLTKIDNRRSFYAKAIEILKANTHKDAPVTVGMIDIDFFKKVNDTYGHEAGDVVLYHFAQLIRKMLPKDDLVARYGGEEFVVLLHNDGEGAMACLEALRIAISKLEIPYQNQLITLTASLGIRENTNLSYNIDTLIAEADHALYHSKNSGRNKTTRYGTLNNGTL